MEEASSKGGVVLWCKVRLSCRPPCTCKYTLLPPLYTTAFGTSVGSKTLKLWGAVAIAAVFEFLGAMLLGGAVTRTIAGGIANTSTFTAYPALFLYGERAQHCLCLSVPAPAVGPGVAVAPLSAYRCAALSAGVCSSREECCGTPASLLPISPLPPQDLTDCFPPACSLHIHSPLLPPGVPSSHLCDKHTRHMHHMRTPPLGMFAAEAASMIWVMIATYLELPVSTTHSMVGGVIGFAMAFGGTRAVTWAAPRPDFPYVSGVVPIIISW